MDDLRTDDTDPPFIDVWEDGRGRWAASVGEIAVSGADAADTRDGALEVLREQVRIHCMYVGVELAHALHVNGRGGWVKPGTYPDLLCPASTGHVAAMLRRASPRYVCLPVFEDGEFRAFIVRDAIGEASELLSRHPIEGVALALALIRVWNASFDPRVEMT